jgi:lysozyme family protein
MTVTLTPELREEYQTLFDTLVIRAERQKDVESLVGKIDANRSRYEAVGGPLAIPWFFIGVIHCLEASLNFKKHLHNGDPLTDRTKNVPAGRPKTGEPPFEWEVSAKDALRLKNLHKLDDWSLPALLYQLERYNGFGYRTRPTGIFSPYLWSFSQHYEKGKYVKDGVFDPEAVSKQCGAAVLLRRMAERGLIAFDSANQPVDPADGSDAEGPLVSYDPKNVSENARLLQEALNAFPGVFLKPDGLAGPRTSDALKRVTGHFLVGDPRAET